MTYTHRYPPKYSFPDNYGELSPEDQVIAMNQFKENMREYDRYRSQLGKLHNFLLGDLAVRSDNYYTGTKRGGNPTQLFYLLSNELYWQSTRDKEVTFSKSDGLLVISVPVEILESVKKEKPAPLGLLRDALDDHCASLLSIQEVTKEQLMDPSWLENQNVQSAQLKLYLSYLKKICAFKQELQVKDKAYDEYSKIFEKETNALKKKYLEEIGLTEEEEKACFVLGSTFNTHPVYKPQLSKIGKRRSKVMDALFSEEDKNLLKTVNVMPSFVTILTMRLVNIEFLVKYSLDDYVGNDKFDSLKIKLSAEDIEKNSDDE